MEKSLCSIFFEVQESLVRAFMAIIGESAKRARELLAADNWILVVSVIILTFVHTL